MPIQISVKKATQNPTVSSGLTSAEPVFNSSNNTLWMGKGATTAPVWIGAPVTGASGAISAGLTGYIPTTNAVKDYVVSVTPFNYVSSWNGATGAITFSNYVTTINGLSGSIGITAGTNITVSITGNNIQISSSASSQSFAIAMAIAL